MKPEMSTAVMIEVVRSMATDDQSLKGQFLASIANRLERLLSTESSMSREVECIRHALDIPPDKSVLAGVVTECTRLNAEILSLRSEQSELRELLDGVTPEVIPLIEKACNDAVDPQSVNDPRIRPVLPERDESGFWYHPAYNPPFEEGATAEDVRNWHAERGMEHDYTFMSSDFCEECVYDSDTVSAWNPTPPNGTGWILVSIFDTEDGAAACWVRYTDTLNVRTVTHD
ncbi:hypothetical protein [Brenneria uluponensis]|uniref:hypothetical protein n=1 Tax=Brenneria uluponensis TaxID=3057057 RepID=UPI0028E66E42|nr:hypothetical protein [Brenneria ulupoensis]